MARPWIEVEPLRRSLSSFFESERESLSIFGRTVNQVFEAFVFASLIQWYRNGGWHISVENPPGPDGNARVLRLKFSTRGRPAGYTFVKCTRNSTEVRIHHQLRVATRAYRTQQEFPANICLDVAVIKPSDLASYGTNDAVPNCDLVTFAEAKHMSAFAELVAGFLGLVHELQPERLKRVRTSRHLNTASKHPAPFLYVSGILYLTAQGIEQTIRRRCYDVDIFTQTEALSNHLRLPASIRSDVRSRARRILDEISRREGHAIQTAPGEADS
jgi:hypothetical protein